MKKFKKITIQVLMAFGALGLLFAGIAEAMVSAASAAPSETIEHALKSGASWVGFSATVAKNLGMINLPWVDTE